MRGKHHLRFLLGDGGQHFVQRRRREGGLITCVDRARLEYLGLGRNPAHLEDLRPAVAEPAVADHQALLIGRQLPRHRLHAVSAAARHHRHGMGVVDLFQGGGDITHHALKRLRHMVQRAVGVDHRIFDQAIGIDVGADLGHSGLQPIRFDQNLH